MTAPTFSLSLIHELRGSPLTVLVAIILLEQSGQIPATAQLLKDVTGYGDHTLTDSLRALSSPTRQIVTRVSGGWRLAQGFQLPLEIQNRDIREFESSTTTALTRLEGRKKILCKAAEEEHQNRAIRGFELTPEQETIHHILKTEGLIGEPTCTRLALQEGMDAITAMAHCYKAALENIETGLLVHRLRAGDGIEEVYRRKAQERITNQL